MLSFNPRTALAWLTLSVLLPAAAAQTESTAFKFNSLTLSGGAQITGSFTWTYQAGDFENGSADFQSLSLPWSNETLATLTTTIEEKSIEINLPGNFHDKGVDITIKLQQPLTATTGALVDLTTSKYEIQQGAIHTGTFIAGSVELVCPPPTNYGLGTPGQNGLTPTLQSSGGPAELGNTAFALQAGNLQPGTSALYLLGASAIDQAVLGVQLLVEPVGATLLWIQASPAGTATTPLPIPQTPSLSGLTGYAQLIAIDAFAPTPLFSASPGLAITICP